MAVAQTDICNTALALLGKPVIASLTDNSDAARVLSTQYDIVRRNILAGRSAWLFAVRRASLPALSTAPVSGPYTTQYQLPTDLLRVLLAGDTYPSMDLSDYRMGPSDAGYSVEGNAILCDYGSPLSLKYIADISDTTLFPPSFVMLLAAMLALACCERLRGSSSKKADCEAARKQAWIDATSSNALEKPPDIPADDTWILARMQ